mmetsp:Transcript_8020/g.19836  ORF Transcript_8020/g.19836 Transcript_8020/m.19836 type:complete len:387 (+) Transcript_8020:398-1558(+)
MEQQDSAPIACVLEALHNLSFGRTLLDLVIVLPPRSLWQRHEDRLDTAARLKAEHSSTVVHKVELHVAAAANLLPPLLLLRELVILVLGNEGDVRRDDRVQAVFREGKDLLGIAVVLVVEEDATQPTRLAAVLDEEVLIRPLLELGVVLGVMLVAHLFVRPMEVLDVLLDKVRGSDVTPAAKPPLAALRLEVPVVEVHRRRVWVARVHHRAQPTGKERHSLPWSIALGTIGATRRRRGEGLLRHAPVDNAERAAGLLEDVALLEHARDAAATALAGPHVLQERRAIQLRDGRADVVLSALAVRLEAAAHVHVGAGEVVLSHEGVWGGLNVRVRVPRDARRRGGLRHRGRASTGNRAAWLAAGHNPRVRLQAASQQEGEGHGQSDGR